MEGMTTSFPMFMPFMSAAENAPASLTLVCHLVRSNKASTFHGDVLCRFLYRQAPSVITVRCVAELRSSKLHVDAFRKCAVCRAVSLA